MGSPCPTFTHSPSHSLSAYWQHSGGCKRISTWTRGGGVCLHAVLSPTQGEILLREAPIGRQTEGSAPLRGVKSCSRTSSEGFKNRTLGVDPPDVHLEPAFHGGFDGVLSLLSLGPPESGENLDGNGKCLTSLNLGSARLIGFSGTRMRIPPPPPPPPETRGTFRRLSRHFPPF